ncbi:MAG: transcriptional regulator, partial [candidate division KSB1 bacterium]
MCEELFEELLESIKQGGAILRGEMKPSRVFEYNHLDVRSIRSRYGFAQTKFADMFGISVAILRNWEQGRSQPEGAASILLRVA